MPERRAITMITIGEEGKRRLIMPREIFSITDAQAKEMDAINPPCCEDPGRRQAQNSEAEDEGAELISQVAERIQPEGRDTRQPSAEALAVGAAVSRARAAAPGNANVSREQPPADDDPL